MSAREHFTSQEFDQFTDALHTYEHFELWEYDRDGQYVGALPERFPSAKAARDERKAMVHAPRLRAYWRIVGFRGGVYVDLEGQNLCLECKRQPRRDEGVTLEPGVAPGESDAWLCPECLARPQTTPYNRKIAAMESRYD